MIVPAGLNSQAAVQTKAASHEAVAALKLPTVHFP